MRTTTTTKPRDCCDCGKAIPVPRNTAKKRCDDCSRKRDLATIAGWNAALATPAPMKLTSEVQAACDRLGMRRCKDKECRRTFQPNNRKHVHNFCSSRCRQRSNRRRHHIEINARRRKEPELRTCATPGCEVQFYRKGMSRRIYCTPKCGRNARRPLYSKICPQCMTQFNTRYRSRKIFCSRKCMKRSVSLAERELIRGSKQRKQLEAGKVLIAKGGRPAEDRKALRVDELREQGLNWITIQRQIDKEFGEHSTRKALFELRARYLKRQKKST